jgi:hypothetical protein
MRSYRARAVPPEVLAGLVPEWRRGGEPGGVTEAPSGAEAAAGA